ncbi:MAG: hypothetical protein AAFY88_28415 [Acidobacteriota bacterium]
MTRTYGRRPIARRAARRSACALLAVTLAAGAAALSPRALASDWAPVAAGVGNVVAPSVDSSDIQAPEALLPGLNSFRTLDVA